VEKANEKKSELRLDMKAKILYAMVQGFFKPADANEFVEEYTKNVKTINAKEYELHFDCKSMKVSSQEMVPMLTACFEMYKKDGFTKVVFYCGESASLKLQIRRVGNIVELPNFEVL